MSEIRETPSKPQGRFHEALDGDRAQKVESTRRGSPRGDDDRFSQRVLPLVEEEPGTDVGAVDDVDDVVEAD